MLKVKNLFIPLLVFGLRVEHIEGVRDQQGGPPDALESAAVEVALLAVVEVDRVDHLLFAHLGDAPHRAAHHVARREGGDLQPVVPLQQNLQNKNFFN